MVMPGYQSYSRNRKGKAKGGIATCILNNESKHSLKVAEGENNNEYIITRHSQFMIPVNIINVYGEQENRTSAEEIRKNWYELVEEIVKIEAKGEKFILIGDLNKHIGDLVKDNHRKVTMGGTLIRELLVNENYALVNNLSIAEGGPFTRVDPSDPENSEKNHAWI